MSGFPKRPQSERPARAKPARPAAPRRDRHERQGGERAPDRRRDGGGWIERHDPVPPRQGEVRHGGGRPRPGERLPREDAPGRPPREGEVRHGGARPPRDGRGRPDQPPRDAQRGGEERRFGGAPRERRPVPGEVRHGRRGEAESGGAPRARLPGAAAPREERAGERRFGGAQGQRQGPPPAAPTAWEDQAAWYDQHQGDGGDDFYRELILPAVLRQLKVMTGRRVLDIGSGQGVLGRALGERQIASVGVDASPALVAAAQRRAGPLEQHRVGDVRDLPAALGDELFDAAAAVLSLQDLDPIEPVLSGAAQALKPGGRLVIVLTHPCFRIPKRTGWGWDDTDGIQYRRVEAYLSPMALPIKTHPGRPADPTRTTSFHRPLATWLNALGAAGLAVVACEELCSHRRGTKGPRWSAEDRAAKEIPQFLVLAAVRR